MLLIHSMNMQFMDRRCILVASHFPSLTHTHAYPTLAHARTLRQHTSTDADIQRENKLGRILTADLLLRRGWENNYFSLLCERNLETAFHLLVEFPWSRECWDRLAGLANLPSLKPSSWTDTSNIKDWMTVCWTQATPTKRKGALSLLHLASWELLGERNRRIFQDKWMDRRTFVQRLKDEIILWNMAGAGIPFDPG